MQMTIPQFCAAVLEKSIPLLNTDDEVIVTEVFHLLNKTLEIVVAIVTADLWVDPSMAARECVSTRLHNNRICVKVIIQHSGPFDISSQ